MKSRRAWAVGIGAVLVGGAGVGLFVVLGGPPPEIAEGRALYEANCMECHGEGALGDGPLAASLPVRPPSILEHLAHHTEDQLVQLIRAGLPPAMPPTSLSDDEVRLVLGYAWTLVPDSRLDALRAQQEEMMHGAH